ncbi:hypothetical protein MHZ92_12665 [Sporosarcina sp. ACRSL]|nr:hypothetical protein [Sporosarcina sp. ACRSL]MCG7344991.1 hypothetical protein [Sporosarcina sp. ACRSL]
MRKGYNPYLLPPWIRKTRFYCKGIIIPISVFQLIRLLLIPTAGDFILLCVLAGLAFCLYKDII